MKIKNSFLHTSYFIFVTLIISQAYAENAGNSAKQEELNQAIEMMRSQGMDEESIKQMESIMQGGMKIEAEKKAVNLEQEQKEFEQKWSNNGNAQVEVEGQTYALKVTTCHLGDLQDFKIDAQQAPGNDDGKLRAIGKKVYISADEFEFHTEFEFSTTTESYRPVIDPALEFDGKKIAWEGKAASKNGSGAEIKFNLEMPCEKGS